VWQIRDELGYDSVGRAIKHGDVVGQRQGLVHIVAY
jgi:hypothetical protein